MIKTIIKCGSGIARYSCVTARRALLVTQEKPDLPPVGEPNVYRYLTGKLGSTGLESGSTSMNVDGSITPQNFYIGSSNDYDIHIMGILILLADGVVSHDKFGAISTLANGFDLKITESGADTYLIDKAKTGGQVIGQSGLQVPYGNDKDAFELTAWTGSSDATTAFIPLKDFIPDGLRIGRGTVDRLTATVNDDLTGLTDFFVKVFGYKHYQVDR